MADSTDRPWEADGGEAPVGLARAGGRVFEATASGRTRDLLGAPGDDPYPGALVPLPLPYSENEAPHWDEDWRLFVPALGGILNWELLDIKSGWYDEEHILRIMREVWGPFMRTTTDLIKTGTARQLSTAFLDLESDEAWRALLRKVASIQPEGKVISPSAPSAVQHSLRIGRLINAVIDKGGVHNIVGRILGLAGKCLSAGRSYLEGAKDVGSSLVGSPYPPGGAAGAAGLARALGPYALPVAAGAAAIGSLVYMLMDIVDAYRGHAFLSSRMRAPVPEGTDGPFAVTALTAAYADCPMLVDRHIAAKISETADRISRHMLAEYPDLAEITSYHRLRQVASGDLEAMEAIYGGVRVADSMEFDRVASKIGEDGTDPVPSALMMFSTGGRIMYGDLDDAAKAWVRTNVSNQSAAILVSVPRGCVRDTHGNLFDVDTSGTSLQDVTLGRANARPVGDFKYVNVTPGVSEANGGVSVVLWHVWWEPDKVHLGLQSDLDSYVQSLDSDHADAVDFTCPIAKVRCEWAQPSEYAGLYIDRFRSETFAGDARCALATVTPLHTGDVIIPRDELVRTPGKPYFSMSVNRSDYVPIYLPRGSVSCNGAHPEVRSWATQEEAPNGYVSIPISRPGDADPSPEGTNAVTVLCWGDESAAWVGTRKDLADYLSKGDRGYSKIETLCRVERNPETGAPLPVVGWPKIARAYPVSVVGICGDPDQWRDEADVDSTCRSVVGALAGAVGDPSPRVLPAMSAQAVRNVLPSAIVNAQLTVIVLCGPYAQGGMAMTGGGVLTGSDVSQAIGIVGNSQTAANDLALGHPRYVLVVSCVPGMSVSAPDAQYGDPVRLMSWTIGGGSYPSLTFGACNAFAAAICSACAGMGPGDTFSDVGAKAARLYREATADSDRERGRVGAPTTPQAAVRGGDGFAGRRMDFLTLPASGGKASRGGRE